MHTYPKLYIRHEYTTYQTQGALLRQQFEGIGRDVHVADYRVMTERQTRSSPRYVSLCVQTESVATVLPRTDFVCLQRLLNRGALDRGEATSPEFGESICVPWDTLQRYGYEPRPEGLYPERYLAEPFPDEAAWRMLQQDSASVPPDLLLPAGHANKPPRRLGGDLEPAALSWNNLVAV